MERTDKKEGFNLQDAANEIIAEGESSVVSTDDSSSNGQTEKNPMENEVDDSATAREVLGKMKSSTPQELSPEFAKLINDLGSIHNGSPIVVNSAEHLKELIQKGFDYTKKTMSHADESRQKQDEYLRLDSQHKEREEVLSQKEQGLAQVSEDNKIIESLLAEWQEKDVDLFNFISDAYREKLKQNNSQKPAIAHYENRFKAYDEKFAELANNFKQKELSSIKDGWEKELGSVQASYSSDLSKLGIIPDWEKVKQVWANDSTNKISVEDAFYSVFGKEINKANISYQKLLNSRNKVNSSIIGKGNLGKSHNGAETVKANSAGDYASILRQAVNNF